MASSWFILSTHKHGFMAPETFAVIHLTAGVPLYFYTRWEDGYLQEMHAFLFSSVAIWTNVSPLVSTHFRTLSLMVCEVSFCNQVAHIFCNAVIVITAVRTTHHNVARIMRLSCLIRETTHHTQPLVMKVLGCLGRCLSSTCLTVMEGTTTYAQPFPWQ